MLWLTGIFSPLCFGAAWTFQPDPFVYHMLVIAALFPPAVTCLGFFYFMFADPGKLLVALTDAADNFLRVAQETLKLELAEVKVCEIFDSPATGCLHERN